MRNIFGKLKGLFRPAPWLAATVVVAALFLPAVSGAAAERKAPGFRNVSSAAAASPIPLAEVALRATEVSDSLRSSVGTVTGAAATESIRQSLPRFNIEVRNQYRETKLLLGGYTTLSGLQSQQQLWQQKQVRATAWLKVLTTRARQLDDSLANLAELQKNWSMTLEIGRSSDAPEAILRLIEMTLTEIAAARPPLQRQRSALLDLQISLARDMAVCRNAVNEIAQAQQSVVKGTFLSDTPPIWSAYQWGRARETLPVYSQEFVKTIFAELQHFASDARLIMTVALSALVFSLILFARHRTRQWKAAGEFRTFASEVFEYPYSASLTIILLILTSALSEVPAHSRAFLQAVSIVPMILVIRSFVDPRMLSWLYALGILFAIDTVRQAFSGVMSVDQAILVLESSIAIGVLGWMMVRKGPTSYPSARFPALRFEMSRKISCLLLLCFGVSLVAAVTGNMNLARLLAPSILVGGFLWLGLYASVRVISGMVGFFLHGWPLRQLRMVQNCRELLEKRFYRVLIWAAIFSWVVRFLYYMGLLEPATSVVKNIFRAKFERGAIAISLGDMLAFSLTVWIAYLLSALFRFVLNEEVYPRLNVAPGRSYAASSLLHYFILALGFIVAIGLMGVNLTKVTVLAGALGVGIGFGLQSVVNNFVSGLILLFERPVSAGDSIEVGDLLGEVRRIGMRSSTVRTWRGADIIVPNSQLISEKVTNWTFSDRKRRIDLPVGLNYGAEPQKVMRLLEEQATVHPEVLKDPAPQCLFIGYGDSSINFELRAWTDQFNDWPRVRSELAVAVYDAVSLEKDMTFPFPQRDVHLVCNSMPGFAPVDPLTTQGKRKDAP